MRGVMTDIEPKEEEGSVGAEPQTSEAETVHSEEEEEEDVEVQEDGNAQEDADKPLDDDLDRRNPQYIPKGGAFYEHDNRTSVQEGEEEESTEVDKKKKVWKESKTSERWLHDCFVEEEQVPKSPQEIIDLYGYDIRVEENAPRARRRRKYGRGPDKYDRKWDDEEAYMATKKVGRGRGKRRQGEEFPPLPNPMVTAEDEDVKIINDRIARLQLNSLKNKKNHRKKRKAEGDSEEPKNKLQRTAPEQVQTAVEIIDLTDDNPPDEGEGVAVGVGRGRGMPPSPPTAWRNTQNDQQRHGPPHPRAFPEDTHRNMNQRPRMEDHIKPFRTDAGQRKSHDGGRPPGGVAIPKEVEELSQSMTKMAVQQRQKPREHLRKELPRETVTNKQTLPENPTNRQNPKRYSNIRKGNTGYYPTEEIELDPRDVKQAIELRQQQQQQQASQMMSANPHLSPQQQQDMMAQGVNVLQRFPEAYNGNPTFIQARTLLPALAQPGLSPQGLPAQALSPQIASIDMGQTNFVSPPMFIDMEPHFAPQGDVLPYPGYPGYPQSQNTELYQTPGGITYYSPEIQTGSAQSRALPPRRPKVAIPILPPPDNQVLTYGTSNISKYLIYKHGWRWQMTAAGGGGTAASGSLKPMKKIVPVTVGVGILGALQWMYIKRRITPNEGEEIRPATNWEVTVYTLLPLRIMSRVWGTLTSINLPVFIRPKIISLYAKTFGVDLDECKVQDLACYRNLSEFFIRPLREECRPIDIAPNSVVSPADGRILNFGRVSSCQVDQVKGITYSLQQFLGEPTWKDDRETRRSKIRTIFTNVNNGNLDCKLSNDQYLKALKQYDDTELYQCVVYLAPGDYHRFHSPVSWKVYFRRHFQGKLLSVNPAIASWIRDLFSLNERAAYIGSWTHGFFSLTAVGATNVGSIKVVFDPSLLTNRWIVRPRHRDLELNQGTLDPQGIEMQKGELFGEFRLGSTIVLIFEAPKNFQFNIKQGQKIKFGESLGAFS